MLTRRHVLQLAAALTAAKAVPTALSPAQAAAALDVSIDAGLADVPRPHVWDADVYDPVHFANALDGLDIEELTDLNAPQDMAAYKQARSALLRELPILNGVRANHPWVKLDEAALSLWCASWMAGVTAGAAYENLRRSLVGPLRVCGRCQGVGSLRLNDPDLDPDAGGPEICPACAGNGTVASPPVRLDLKAA